MAEDEQVVKCTCGCKWFRQEVWAQVFNFIKNPPNMAMAHKTEAYHYFCLDCGLEINRK